MVFSALSYVFNREMHEILIYSIIALENIYAPKDKGISYTLQKNNWIRINEYDAEGNMIGETYEK